MQSPEQKSKVIKVFLTLFLFAALFGVAFSLSLVFTSRKGVDQSEEILPKAEVVLPQSSPTPEASPTTPPPTISLKNIGEGCKLGGCNSEICLNESDEPAVSTCVYQEYFACYRDARCEKQLDGKCGWTQTPALESCISQKEEVFCGGIIAKNCPEGYFCELDGNYPDSGGKCVRQ